MLAQQAYRITPRRKAQNKALFCLGALLCALFLLQEALHLKWVWLQELQSDQAYKRWSGLVLLLYIVKQWTLSLARARGQGVWAKRLYPLHRALGVLAPVFFYLHATTFGYGYLGLLSVVYLSNIVIGLCHRGFWESLLPRFAFAWMIVHITLSVLIVALMGYHVVIAFSYK